LLALLVLSQRPHNWRRWLVSMIVVGVGYTIVAGPLLLYSLTLVSSFNERVSDVFVFSESALKARPPLAVFDEAVGRHLLMFNVRGDGNGRHHAPNRPMLDFLTGLGFIVGCGVLARGWQDWRARFLLGGLALGLLPSFLAVDAPHALRSLHAAAFACVLAAVGWIELGRLFGMPQLRVSVRGRMLQAPLSTVFSTLLVVLALSLNARTYLIAMPADEAVWKSFYPTHTRIGEYLRATLDGSADQPPGLFYVSAGMAANSVLRYLDHGLSVATFDGAALSTAATPGAHFVLSGYTYQRDEQLLRAALRYDFVPTLYGPPLPDGKTPSFVIYTVK
jgi:hypothetical protein